jgi:hypothetical protein
MQDIYNYIPETNQVSTVYNVRTIYKKLHYSDNIIIHSTAPTCFDVCTSSLCVLLSYIKMYTVCEIRLKSLQSVVIVNKTLKCS